MSVIIVDVRGGVVQSVYGDKIENLDVIVRDWDNIDAGDPDPIEDEYMPEEYYW
jgi:hypothetical protein